MSDQRIQRYKQFRDVTELALTAAFLWFALHPEQLVELEQRAQETWNQVERRRQAWQTLRSLRRLPVQHNRNRHPVEADPES